MTSLGEYVVDRLIKERNYDCLAYLIVSRLEELVEVLRETYPNEKEKSLREMALQLKREAINRLSHPLMNICPYCLSKKVENLDFEYRCLDCGRVFSKDWKDERFIEIANALYSYLKCCGMTDVEVRKYLFDVFGIVLKGVKNVRQYSKVELLNLISSTFLALYDDPYFRNKFLKDIEVFEDDFKEKVVERRKEEVLREWEEAKAELAEEDKLVLDVLKKNRRGLSYSEISKLTGLSYSRVRTIVKWLRRFGLVEVYRIGRSCSVVLK